MATLIETARQAGTFNTLLTALDKAGLTETLSGDGPFTVFAPTDDAFDELEADVLDKLLDDRERLTAVLKYHVLAGTYHKADLDTSDRATTLEGDDVVFEHDDDSVRVDEATVSQPDITADNGVIHVVDQVILPEKYLY